MNINMPEICEALEAFSRHVDGLLEGSPNNMDLQNALRSLTTAIGNIDLAEQCISSYNQARVDQGAVDAIVTALQANYGSDSNAGPANGMLADIASPGGAALILQVVRNAGYVVSPAPPF